MGEFDRNPDIDEKPPIPLRDALEKMKPFLMAYEGIQSQEEWEVFLFLGQRWEIHLIADPVHGG